MSFCGELASAVVGHMSQLDTRCTIFRVVRLHHYKECFGEK
jgi:hypothetical protein